jgi:hypothetical protein
MNWQFRRYLIAVKCVKVVNWLWFSLLSLWCQSIRIWGGWTLCHKWQTVHLEAGVDEKHVDGSYRWTNVTVVNCHSRRFVGWTLNLGRNVAWSVCGWTDRQGTVNTTQLASCRVANWRHIFRRLLHCTAYHIRTRYSNNNQNEKETYSIDVTNSTEQEAVKLISCCINTESPEIFFNR